MLKSISPRCILLSVILAFFSSNVFSINATIVGGQNHGAYIEKGVVFAFGKSYFGETGPNAALSSSTFNPIDVGLTNVTSIASVMFTNIALKDDNTVWMWGRNPITGSKHQTPIEIVEFQGATDITLTTFAAFALIDGQVLAYTFDGNVHTVTGITGNVISIDGHNNHAVFLTDLASNGQVFALGDNSLGQLGNSSVTSSYVNAVSVLDVSGFPITNITAIDAGSNFTLALSNIGNVLSWGSNQYGVLGNFIEGGNRHYAEVMVGFTDIIEISASKYASLALDSTGTLFGCGWHNIINQTSYNKDSSAAPLLTGVEKLEFGNGDAHYLWKNGRRMGWGSAQGGELGSGDQIEQHDLVPLLEPVGYVFPEPVVVIEPLIVEPLIVEPMIVEEVIIEEPILVKSSFTITFFEADEAVTTQTIIDEEVLVCKNGRTVEVGEDCDRGHGNDADGFDDDNPGKRTAPVRKGK